MEGRRGHFSGKLRAHDLNCKHEAEAATRSGVNL